MSMSQLDPSVVQSAREAGVPEGQLNALARLLGKSNRMADQPGGGRGTAAHGMDLLSESEEEEAEDEEEEAEKKEKPARQAEAVGSAPIEQAVVQLTKIVGRMSRKPTKDL